MSLPRIMMKIRSLAVLLAVLISAPVAAQREPAEVTDAQIAKYKALAASSCQEAGTKQGDPKERVDAFCGCLVRTITTTMTRAEWQQAYFYSMKGQSKEERQVLAPHLKNVDICMPKPAAAPKPQAGDPAPQPAQKPGQGLRPPPAK
jgi:hypothetical protein